MRCWFQVRSTRKELLFAKRYIRGDFKLHVKEKSRVSDHCTAFSLSDPQDRAFGKACDDHDHDLGCDSCNRLDALMENISDRLNITRIDSELEHNEAHYLLQSG